MFGNENKLKKLMNKSANAIELFTNAKAGLEEANSNIKNLIDKIRSEIDKRKSMIIDAELQIHANDKVIKKITSIIE